MVTFEGYDRRIDKINACIKEYGLESLENCKAICENAGIDVEAVVLEYNEFLQELLDAYDDAERAYIAKNLLNEGEISEYAANLIIREESLNNQNYNVPYEKQLRYQIRQGGSPVEAENARLLRQVELLKEELEVRGISQKVFSEKTGISYTMLNEILNCKRPVTSDLSLLFESALGINSEMLINMQTRDSLAKSRLEPSMASRLSKIRQACASWLL